MGKRNAYPYFTLLIIYPPSISRNGLESLPVPFQMALDMEIILLSINKAMFM